MKTRTKVWLITAVTLTLIGCILFAGVMAMLGWDFGGLATVQYETTTHEISEAFDNISINTNTAGIEFALSPNGKCTVECYEEENAKHSVTVKDGTLTIERIDKQSVHIFIGLNFDSPKITVYLPKTQYASLFIDESTGDIKIPKEFQFSTVSITLSTGAVDFHASASEMIKIKTSTGDIHVQDLSAGALDLSVSTGRITVSDVTCAGDVAVRVSTGKTILTDIACKNIMSTGSTGDISLSNVIAEQTLSIKRSTGDVTFADSDAAELFVNTDTGDVTGRLLTDKVFIAKSDTGHIHVPNSVTGGRCEITTDTGDINITVG